jgi:hypothetical protein
LDRQLDRSQEFDTRKKVRRHARALYFEACTQARRHKRQFVRVFCLLLLRSQEQIAAVLPSRQSPSLSRFGSPARRKRAFCRAVLTRRSNTHGSAAADPVDVSSREIAGASVTLIDGDGKSRAVRTGPSGAFRFIGVAAGFYRLSGEKTGFRGNTTELTFPDDKPLTLVLLREPDAGGGPLATNGCAIANALPAIASARIGVVPGKQSPSVAGGDRLAAGRRPHTCKQLRQVCVDLAFTDAEPVGDLASGVSVSQQLKRRPLSRRDLKHQGTSHKVESNGSPSDRHCAGRIRWRVLGRAGGRPATTNVMT